MNIYSIASSSLPPIVRSSSTLTSYCCECNDLKLENTRTRHKTHFIRLDLIILDISFRKSTSEKAMTGIIASASLNLWVQFFYSTRASFCAWQTCRVVVSGTKTALSNSSMYNSSSFAPLRSACVIKVHAFSTVFSRSRKDRRRLGCGYFEYCLMTFLAHNNSFLTGRTPAF